MNRIVGAAKAAYFFFAGDAIILVAVLLAFGLTGLLSLAHAPNIALIVVFIALIVSGLTVTLGRELRGRPRGG